MANDIVDLRIEAENLASPELIKAAEDVEGLGRASERAQREVEQLEITRDSIDSFREAGERIDLLQNDVAQATTEFKRLQTELKRTENATEEQTNAVNRQQQVVKRLQGDLRAAEREYRTIDSALRTVGVNTRQFANEQERLSTELVSARQEADRLNRTYNEQVDRIREKVSAQRRSVDASQAEAAAQEELNKELEDAEAIRRKEIQQAEQVEQANRELVASLQRYERELAKLNEEKAEGNLTTGNYIRAEANLRRQMQLTSSQVSTSRRAVEADIESKTRAVRSTDALTTVTRRLAQAYTVLIAAQGAAQAAIGNIQAFGEFEQAVINIERTTGIASDQVINLADDILRLGEDVTPTATNELLKFAEVAGQLGVKSTGEILQLVAAADQLGVATNIAGDEAATLLTRILQVTGEGVGQIGNLSSSVVTLGNNFAATESDIVKFGREVVTATRDIDLSSGAALGLGTALAVSGQRAEASRTALGRLSQTIRRAATSGGADLESLANITRLTGEQIQESLGEDSEKVILGFVQGLARAQEQGEVTLDVLRRFGIDGQEASAVFSALAANADLLADAIAQSNGAYIQGNAQIIEASRAYASQESAVGRLTNQFGGLRKAIGEAYSDEVDLAVRKFSEAINDNESSLIELFEILPDVVSSFDSLANAADNLFATFGSDGSGALSGVIEGFTVFGNAVTSGLNTLVLSLQATALGALEFAANFRTAFGIDVPDTLQNSIDELRVSFNNTKDSILEDSQDISDSIARLSGTSSRTFEDLIDTIDRYEGSLSFLTDAQREQVEQIRESGTFNAELQETYIGLTAAIVRANRQKEIETTLGATQIENQVKLLIEKEKESELERALTGQIADRNRLQAIEQDLSENLLNVKSRLREEAEKNNITQEQLLSIFNRLDEQYDSQITKLREVTEEQNRTNTSTANFKTEAQLVADTLSSAANITSAYSAEQQALRVELDKTVETIRALTTRIEEDNLATSEKVELIAQLSAEQQKYNELLADEARANEINNATFFELQQQRTLAEQQLQSLTVAFQSGTISAGEYADRQQALAETISELNGLLGENTDAVKENATAQDRATQSVKENSNETEKAAQFGNLLGDAYQYLNRQFDFTNSTAQELTDRLQFLEEGIENNRKVTSAWWREIAEVNSQGFVRERQVINETKLLRTYTQVVESGTASLSQLNAISTAAELKIRELGDNQLEPLRRAIADAKREFQDLNENIDDALNETLDRLDEISGNQADIVRRRYEQERQQYEELLTLAQQSGDQATINRAQQVLRNLERAQRLEFQQQFSNNTNAANGSQTTATQQAITTRNVNVTLRTPDGNTTTVAVADDANANNLLDALSSFGEVSTEGNN